MSASLLSALHSCFCHTASHLFLSGLEEGSEAGMFSFVFDFWDSHKIGYKPLMLRREGGNPPQKNNALFVVFTHRLQHPNVPVHVRRKVIQVGAGSAKREMSVLKSAHLCIALHAELFGVTAMGPAAFSWCRETSRPHWRGHWTPSTEQTSP